MKVNELGFLIEEKTDRYPDFPIRQKQNIEKLTEYIKKTDAEIAKLKEEVFELKDRIRQLEGRL